MMRRPYLDRQFNRVIGALQPVIATAAAGSDATLKTDNTEMKLCVLSGKCVTLNVTRAHPSLVCLALQWSKIHSTYTHVL